MNRTIGSIGSNHPLSAVGSLLSSSGKEVSVGDFAVSPDNSISYPTWDGMVRSNSVPAHLASYNNPSLQSEAVSDNLPPEAAPKENASLQSGVTAQHSNHQYVVMEFAVPIPRNDSSLSRRLGIVLTVLLMLAGVAAILGVGFTAGWDTFNGFSHMGR